MANNKGCNSFGAEPNQFMAPEPRALPSTAATLAVGQGALDGEDLGGAGYGHTAAQQHLQAFDQLVGQARQVGQGAFTDLAGLTVGLAQKDGGGRVAIGYGLDIHDFRYMRLL